MKQALATSLDFLNPDADKIAVSGGIDLDTIRVLENLGIRNFTEAENGKQAVGLIQQHYFDLVVTDYNMPEMDGRELTEYIRTQS